MHRDGDEEELDVCGDLFRLLPRQPLERLVRARRGADQVEQIELQERTDSVELIWRTAFLREEPLNRAFRDAEACVGQRA